MIRLLLICALAFMLAPVAWGAHAQPLTFFTSYISISPNVSQQPGVTNPTKTSATNGCGWDAADYLQRDAVLNSSLADGATATDSFCLVQDWSPRVIGTSIAASSPDLALTVSFSTGGSRQIASVYDSRLRLWVYKACVNVPTYQMDDPALQTVDGSGGGVGVPTTVTLSLTNPSSKTVSTVRYYWGFSPGTCP